MAYCSNGALLTLRLGPGLSLMSPLTEIKRLYNQVSHHILFIETRKMEHDNI